MVDLYIIDSEQERDHTIMTLRLRTDRSGQTVQTQIRLLLEEQSDQGLHCLLFHLHLLDKIPKGLASFLEFYVDYSKVFWRPKIKELYSNLNA